MSDLSNSTGNVDFSTSEMEFLSLICEYFFLRGFPHSLAGLESEIKNRNITLTNNMSGKSTIYQDAILQKSFILNSLLESFDRGDREEFLHLWNANISSSARESKLGLRIEFQTNLHFAVVPIRLNLPLNSSEVVCAKEIFKEYLNERSSHQAVDDDMFPFYALPYLKEVRSHPSFQDLFRPSWLQSLRADVESFLKEFLNISSEPQLLKIFQHRGSNSGASIAREGDNRRDELEQLSSEYKREQVSYIKRYKALQESYQTLIDLAMQLVEALEDSLHGRPISEEYITSMCRRLFGVSTKSIPAQDSALGASLLRASIASHSGRLEAGISQNVPLYPSLHLQRVKSDLCNLEGRQVPLLLQALRLRLTNYLELELTCFPERDGTKPSLPGEQRDTVLNAYIREDLLGVRLDSETPLLSLLSADPVRKESLSRLLNALGSLAPGRTYLALSWDLLRAVFKAVQLERDDTPTRQNLTGVMQKLSLRRGPQSFMISLGVVSWLSRLLETSESLSEYSLHYTLALLMNLSLRSKGRAGCVAHCPRLLSHLSRFLQLESAELRSYANGIMYSILSVGKVRGDAVGMGLQELLECVHKSSSDENRRQIEFVLHQLELPPSSDTGLEGTESDDEEDEEDTDDPSEPIEGDLEDSLRAASPALQGEELLCQKYLYFPPNHSFKPDSTRPGSRRNQVTFLEGPLSRPITPRSFAHKQSNPISLPLTATNVRSAVSDSSLLAKSKQKGPTTRRPNSGPKTRDRRSTHPSKSHSDPSLSNDISPSVSMVIEKSGLSNSCETKYSSPEVRRKTVIMSTQITSSISVSSSFSPGSKIDPQPSVSAIRKLEGQISRETMSEYKEVFVSRPRINRTPEPEDLEMSFQDSYELGDLTRSEGNMTVDSIASASYPSVSESVLNEAYSSKEVESRAPKGAEDTPLKPLPTTRSSKQTDSKSSKAASVNTQNTRSVVTRARSKAKQAK